MANDNGKGKLAQGVGYQGYSLDTGLERAALLFREKYGRAPAQVATAGAIILAGPIGGGPSEVGGNGPQSLTARAEAARGAVDYAAMLVDVMGQDWVDEEAAQLALELGAAA